MTGLAVWSGLATRRSSAIEPQGLAVHRGTNTSRCPEAREAIEPTPVRDGVPVRGSLLVGAGTISARTGEVGGSSPVH